MRTTRTGPIKAFAAGIYDGPHATPPEAIDGPVFLGIRNVTPEGRLDLSEVKFISEHDYPKWTRRVTPTKDDIVFSYEATLHRYALIPEDFRGCLGRRMGLIRPDTTQAFPRYLHYYLLSPLWRAVVERNIINGATVDRIPLVKLPDFPVTLPSLDAQKAAAGVLAAYDDLIENNRRRVQLLEEAARALYTEWFVHLRFPGHEHSRIINGIPDGWCRQTVGDICEEVREIASPDKVNADTPYIGLEHIPRRSIALCEWGRADEVTSTKHRFRAGEILFGKIRPYFHKVGIAFVDGVASSDAIVIRPASDELWSLALMTLSSDRFVATASQQVREGSKMPRAHWGLMKQYVVPVPKKGLLETFNNHIVPITAQLRTLTLENRKLREARDLLCSDNERPNNRMSHLTEDTLVQQTTAEYMRDELRWDLVYAYNLETFGPEGTLGRTSDSEVVLTRYLRAKLIEFNPGLPEEAYDSAIREIVEYSSTQTYLATNQDKYGLLKDGVLVSFRGEKGELLKRRLRVFNFDDPEQNHFLAVRELWIKGDLYRRRADIIGFVNGIPLLFIECKNVHKDIETAYRKNLADYKDTVPHLFHHNAIVILGNGVNAKIGSISAKYEYFHEWKRLSEAEPGVVDMETLLKGVCGKRNLIDIFENFIVFDDSSGKLVKVLARNHQVLGVNQALEAVKDRKQRQGKLGVFWHTQGAGKSYSMVFFTRKVHRKLGGNFTFLVCTDRDDLDTQIYKTFAGCGLADNDRDHCRAGSGEQLVRLLSEHKAYVFTLIQKFNQEVDLARGYSLRDDIIVITDEAHRTQYGTLALNMRNALPNASYIGFTGTPLFKDDEITRRVFGGYVSTYDFQRAVDDKATVPLYYDARGDKLGISTKDLNERIAAKLEELETGDIDIEQRLERELKREYHIITAEKRLKQVARDFVEHYSNAWETGKAMLVCIDKLTCVRLYSLIAEAWQERLKALEAKLPGVAAEERKKAQQQIAWMGETRMAVVVSEEQGEVDKFRSHGLDITPHRRLMKQGFELPDGSRIDLEEAFKKEEHPFRVAIVCAMWLTGFDVPSLSTLYLDKPLKAHTLMQAIARANRVNEGKNNGLVVDYCGILKNLRKALATFAGTGDQGHGGGEAGKDPARPEEELIADLAEAIAFVRAFLTERKASLDDIIKKTGFARNAAILAAKEAANENDETRKRFEIMCREVFKKFKACINIKAVNAHRAHYEAVNIVYKSLQQDREKANIDDIIRQLQGIVDDAITTAKGSPGKGAGPYDISRIDFDRLRKEFERSPAQYTTVQNLKQKIEEKLQHLLAQNPLRTDFQQHYEEIVANYNREKDRVTIEQTFEALMKFMQQLNAEETRAIREGLDEESLAIFDILRKPDLNGSDIKRIKKVATELLETLKKEKLRIDHWRDKESTRDAVRLTIHDFLYSDRTGLPVDSYTETDVFDKTDQVFSHVFRVYPTVPSPYYTSTS